MSKQLPIEECIRRAKKFISETTNMDVPDTQFWNYAGTSFRTLSKSHPCIARGWRELKRREEEALLKELGLTDDDVLVSRRKVEA